MINLNNLNMIMIGSISLLILSCIPLVFQIKKKVKYDIKYKEATKNVGTIEEVNAMLDAFISTEFESYKALHLDYKNLPNITEKMEIKIREDLMEIITIRIANGLLLKMSYFYSKEGISDVIAEKVYMIVMAYALHMNNRPI